MHAVYTRAALSGVKIRDGVTAERGVSLISVVQLIFGDVEATGEVKWVVHARREQQL